MHKLAFLAVAGLLLAGCSTPTQSALDNNDPYEATNRATFRMNQRVDNYTLRPTASFYNNHVPEGVRDSIHNALENMHAPVYLVNDLLQAEPGRGAETVARFMINSSFGVGGLFDLAAKLGIQPHTEDFGQTLGVWGVGEGPYLMLPFLGPDPPRDAFGQVADFAFDPTIYISIKHHYWWIIGREYVTLMEMRARNLETLDDIERDSLDFYATTRSLYRQLRANEIRNGAPPP